MKLTRLAIGVAFVSFPFFACGQSEPIRIPNISPPLGLNEQLNLLNAKIDREIARGLFSKRDADEFHREVNSLQAESSDDRLQNGGQLKEADRFHLQARISQLRERIDRGIARSGGTAQR